jgi:hypothetical protein
MTVELDIHPDIVSRKLPRVEVQPVVWDLDLVAIDDFLLEDTVSVTEAIAPGRIIERGQAVEEASGQATQASISESGIMLLTDDILDSEAQFGEASCGVSFST